MAARTRRRRGVAEPEESYIGNAPAENGHNGEASPTSSDSPSGGSQPPATEAEDAGVRPRRTRRQVRPFLDSVTPDEALELEYAQEAPRAFKPSEVAEAPGKRRTRNRTYDEFSKTNKQGHNQGTG